MMLLKKLVHCAACVLAATNAAEKKSTTKVIATPGVLESLSLHYVLTAAADLHYVVLPSGASEPTALEIKEFAQARTGVVARPTTAAAAAGTVVSEEATVVDLSVSSLTSDTEYDTFFVAEATDSNGVFGKITRVLKVSTHPEPLEVTKFQGAPARGVQDAVTIRFDVTSAGTVHFAACLDANPPTGAKLLGKWQEAKQGCILGKVYIEEIVKDFAYNITRLTAATTYSIMLVGEVVDTGGIIGEESNVVQVSTHASPPVLQGFSWLPENGSSTSAAFSFTTDDSVPACILHYIVAKADVAVKLDTAVEIYQTVTAAGGPNAEKFMSYGSLKSQDVSFPFSIKKLEPDASYRLFVAVETAESFGVVTSLDGTPTVAALACTTHLDAPVIESAVMQPYVGKTDCITVNVNASRGGLLHFMVVKDIHKPVITSVVDFFELKDPVERGQVVLQNDTGFAQFNIQNLSASTVYVAYMIAETSDSFGVYSKISTYPSVQELRVSTNDLPPTAKLISLEPVFGTINSIAATVQLSSPASILYNVSKISTSNTTSDVAICDKPAGGKCEFLIENLDAGTKYSFSMVSETSQHVRGVVLNEVELNAITHPFPPAVTSFRADPMDATDTAFQFTVSLNATGILHSAVYETEGTQTALAMLDKLVVCAAANAKDVDLPAQCKTPQLQYNASVVSEGQVSITIDKQKPNTSYSIVMITESPSSGVYGYLLAQKGTKELPRLVGTKPESGELFLSTVTTHAPAPTIIKMSAVPLNGTVDTIFVSFEMKTCGLVHYTLSNTDFKDPVRISDSTLEPRLARFGVVELTTYNQTCTGNISLAGLESNKSYHVTGLSETPNSKGVYGLSRYPSKDVSLVVTTHSHPPTFKQFTVEPTEFESTSLTAAFELNHYGFLHYVLLLRELNSTQQENTTEDLDPKAHTLTVSQLNVATLLPVSIRDASKNCSDFFGPGVIANDTISVSRADVAEGKIIDKKLDKLLPGTRYELCVVSETADSNGVFGQVECKTLETYADYSMIQDTQDAIQLVPTAAQTDSLILTYTMAKALVGSHADYPIGALVGRVPYFAVYSDRTNPREGKAIIQTTPGQRNVEAHGILQSMSMENTTHVTLIETIRGLRTNHEHTAYVVSQSYHPVYSKGKVSHISANTTATARTHAAAPRLVEYSVRPTDASTIGISIKTLLGDTAKGLIHVVAVDPATSPSCKSLSTQSLVDMIVAAETNASATGCAAAVFRRLNNGKTGSWDLNSTSCAAGFRNDTSGSWTYGALLPDTTYDIYIGTETVGSEGVYSTSFTAPTRTHTHSVAPAFDSLTVQPKPSSTSELEVQFQLAREGHVHVVVAKSGDINETCSSPVHISQSRQYHSVSNKEDNCSSISTQHYGAKEVDASLVGSQVSYTIGYLSPNTSYDIFVVSESYDSNGIVSDATMRFYNVSSHGVAPILMSHAVFPTPGDPLSISVNYRLNTEGVLHLLVVQEDNHENGTTIEPTGFLAPVAIAQKSIVLDMSKADSEQLEIIPVPFVGTLYTVYLSTETTASHGVFGTVATVSNIRTHSHPPQVLEFTAKPMDATMDGIQIAACINDTQGHLHVAVMRQGAAAPTTQIIMNTEAASAVSFTNFTFETACQTANIRALNPGTVYELYYVAESFHSFGVIGTVNQLPIRGKTHGAPPILLEDMDCTLAPNCKKIGREECTLKINTCGECLSGWSSGDTIGASNTPCTLSSTTAAKGTDPAAPKTNPTAAAGTSSTNPTSASTSAVGAKKSSAAQEESVAPSSIESVTIDCPPNSVKTTDGGSCACMDGFVLNDKGTACLAKPDLPYTDIACPLNSSPIGPSECTCNEGFGLNTAQTACIVLG